MDRKGGTEPATQWTEGEDREGKERRDELEKSIEGRKGTIRKEGEANAVYGRATEPERRAARGVKEAVRAMEGAPYGERGWRRGAGWRPEVWCIGRATCRDRGRTGAGDGAGTEYREGAG